MTGRRDEGSATVEFAVALPAVALVLGLVMGAATWGVGAVRVQSAANQAARVAIASPPTTARDVATRIAGPGSVATVAIAGDWIVVSVSAPAPWGPTYSAQAVARAQD